MRKKLISAVFIFLVVLFTFGLIGCNNTAKKVSQDITFEQTIEEKIYNIAHPKDSRVAMSSNPYDYIHAEGSLDDYKYIVSQGEKSLNYMLNKLAVISRNGLEEYIMALACSEILKQDPDLIKWSSGREWYNNYIKANK